jgi:tetratricopeptide (TPR) repeat protein
MSSDADADAQHHLHSAADAEAAFDWRAAITAYEAALSSLRPGDDEAAVLTALGRCYWNLSEARTAWRTLRRAISLYQQRGDGPGQARATLEISRIWGPPERHVAMLDDALAALGDADAPLRARLLLRYPWHEDTSRVRWDEAMAIAEAHALEDVLAFRTHDEGWRALDAGDLESYVAKLMEAHDVYVRTGAYDNAGGSLRNVGFQLIECGQLDRGYGYARRCFEYASRVGLLFTAQLALMDMVAVHYARGEFDECERLLAQSPGETDFRADLYRMWMTEDRGDTEGALRYMVDPQRGGNSPGATAQVHAAAAGALYRAGRTEAAAQALDAFASLVRENGWVEDFIFDGPAALECILGLGDDALVTEIDAAFEKYGQRRPVPTLFSTLQGRSTYPLLAGVAARLGRADEARRWYREGIEWCERERCIRDAQLCREGLAALDE